MTQNKDIPFEKAMTRLEEIVAALEKGESSLEDSLAMFEEGVALGKRCREILDRADARIRKLVDVDAQGNASTEELDDAP